MPPKTGRKQAELYNQAALRLCPIYCQCMRRYMENCLFTKKMC